MDDAEGWDECNASASEANIRADRCAPKDVQELQRRTAEKFQRSIGNDKRKQE